MANPVIAEVLRGTIVESRHRGSYAVSDSQGKLVLSSGDMTLPIYPRSAFKAFQCVPLIESGAADRFGLTDEEIALCCASHQGEPVHVNVARSILAKAGIAEDALECGTHAPLDSASKLDLARRNELPHPIHNCCSGKHAGMLALAVHLGVDPKNYVSTHHAVQRHVAASIEQHCGVTTDTAPLGVDGCSVPSWAMPLPAIAHGFSKLALPANGPGQRIIRAVRAHPYMIAGNDNFDTRIMQTVPRLFLKCGAEGVYCGCIPHAGLGFALKCDDGAGRAVEVAIAGILLKLDCWTAEERASITTFSILEMYNWRKINVGRIRATV